MKRIAYIELDTHAEIARNFLELTQGSEDFMVDFYFSPKVARQIKANNSRITVCDASSLVQEMASKTYDLVIIGTAHRYFKTFLSIVRNFCTAVIVHNINFSKSSKWALIKTVFKKDIRYRLKLLLKEGLFSVPKLYEGVIQRFILDKSLQSKGSGYLPVFYFEEKKSTKSEVLTVVIPGAVSQQRRNYRHVLEKINGFKSGVEMRFVFLGKVANVELQWLKEAEKNLPNNISFLYFEEKVPQDVFDRWMDKANVLWCPVQRETTFMSIEEYYGSTKMSGNVGDAIKAGKAAIFPANYKTSYPFIFAEKEDIEAQILHLSQNFVFDFSANFSKEKIRRQLQRVLADLVEKNS